MKAIFKKTAAFAASAMLAAALAVPTMTASAATPPDLGAATPTTLEKTITVYNDDNATVYVPSITYTYSVEPAAGGKTVTDKNGNQSVVKAGIDGGIVMGTDATAVFPTTGNETVAASAAGVPVTDTFEIKFDASVFSSAGIYRYLLTEDVAAADLKNAGISRPAEYKNTRYIDVYVKKNADGVMEIAGSVVFFADDDLTKSTEKTNGFTDKTGTNETEEFSQDTDPVVSVADKYFTYNYVVKKVVENSYTNDEKFDFTIDVAGTTGQKFFYSPVDGTVATATTEGTVGTPVTASLGNNNSIILAGLPANVTVAVKESNGNPATYDVTVADTGTATLALNNSSIKNGEETGFTAQNISAYTGTESEKPDANLIQTTFTNKLVDISPTGLVFMIAPFVIMLAAGAFLFGMVTKNRKKDDAESII